MSIEERRKEALSSLKDDFKLLGIAFQRLWRDVIELIKCIRVGKIEFGKINIRLLIILVSIAFVGVVLFFTLRSCESSETLEGPESTEVRPPYAFKRQPRVQRPEVKHRIQGASIRKYFNDLNDTHLSAAKKIGIAPLASREVVDNASRKLVELNDSDAYIVDKLTHSIPFLVPEAAALLKRIGENFQDSLVMKHMPPHKIIVSSVLRTQSDVKKLGRNNVNSSKNSAHCYATTIDITYKRFFSEYGEEIDKTGKLKHVLEEVLRDLKVQGCCYIKHEKKQACFHITARSFPKE